MVSLHLNNIVQMIAEICLSRTQTHTLFLPETDCCSNKRVR